MPVQQLPLMKGVGKDFANADYVDFLPVNMLATPKEVLGSSGYLRSFPGVIRRGAVAGVSRGSIYNTSQNLAYRVLGGRLYGGTVDVADVPGSGRVSMACSYTSQAVAYNGTMAMYRYDGDIKKLENWPVSSGYTQYNIGSVRDICRVRGRYAWAKDGSDTFGVTDLEDESHPDRYRALYRAESQPDGIMGIDNWRDFVVCFGTSTTEYFSLTGATDAQSAIYVSQPSMMVQKGIAGTYCKVKYADSHAIISHPATGAPSVYVINSGQYTQIATATIEKILISYSADELSKAFMETVRFNAHELLIIHLPRHVLAYDASASQSGPQWSLLCSGVAGDPHRGTDYICEGNIIICGDKKEATTGQLKESSSEQYSEQQEHILYTPLFKVDNARVFDFELESSSGAALTADRMFVSATTDGINYGREQIIPWNAPFKYDSRVIWKRIGRIRKNLGFKVRVVTKSPVTLSGCQIRIE